MKAYKIYQVDHCGFEGAVKYTLTYNKAIQIYNDKIRAEIKDVGEDIVDKYDFSGMVGNIRGYSKDSEIICRKYPIIMYEEKNRTITDVCYWEKTSYESERYDIISNSIILEEIELME